jgi:MerC mercury resistance protein
MFKKNNNKLDKIGICVSLLCAVHCAMLPLIITLLPLIGFKFLANEYFEMAIIASSLLIGYTSLRGSYRKHYNSKPLIIITQGFMVIFIGKIFVATHYEWLFLTAGGLLIATAHFYNSRLSMHAHEDH